MKSDTSKPVSSHISRAFVDLGEQISSLQKEIGSLEEKLIPVIRPAEAEGDDEATEGVGANGALDDANVPLANQVRLLARQIHALRVRVTDVVERIEL